jgi:hypothetical protein
MAQPTSDFALRYNQVIVQIHQAELAGATSAEIAELLVLVNNALDLNEQAAKLTSPADAQTRAQLLAQVDVIMNSVETKASQLEILASQRTRANEVVAYSSGVIASLLGTVAFSYGISFWRKYRIKRTFQMRIIPK